MPSISFQMLDATHEIESEISLECQLFCSCYNVPPISKQGTVEVDTMKCTKLKEPPDVVHVFIGNDSICQNNNAAIAKFRAERSQLSVIVWTLVMTKVDEQNRNVHRLSEASNWETNKHAVEMGWLV